MMKIIVLILTALFSLIALPLEEGFRITFGVVALFACIHAFKLKNPISLAFVAGLIVCTLRLVVGSMAMEITGREASFYFLELAFYLGYGFLYYYSVVKNPSTYPMPLVVAFAICDAGGNFLEYFIRSIARDTSWNQTSLATILLAAAVRSILIVLIIWVLKLLRIDEKYKGGQHDRDY